MQKGSIYERILERMPTELLLLVCQHLNVVELAALSNVCPFMREIVFNSQRFVNNTLMNPADWVPSLFPRRSNNFVSAVEEILDEWAESSVRFKRVYFDIGQHEKMLNFCAKKGEHLIALTLGPRVSGYEAILRLCPNLRYLSIMVYDRKDNELEELELLHLEEYHCQNLHCSTLSGISAPNF